MIVVQKKNEGLKRAKKIYIEEEKRKMASNDWTECWLLSTIFVFFGCSKWLGMWQTRAKFSVLYFVCQTNWCKRMRMKLAWPMFFVSRKEGERDLFPYFFLCYFVIIILFNIFAKRRRLFYNFGVLTVKVLIFNKVKKLFWFQ